MVGVQMIRGFTGIGHVGPVEGAVAVIVSRLAFLRTRDMQFADKRTVVTRDGQHLGNQHFARREPLGSVAVDMVEAQ